MTRPLGDYTIIPDSGYFGSDSPATGAIPSSFSRLVGSHDPVESGYPQHTFLGASIVNFNMNGGFGDSSSTLNLELVNDEYNLSDGTPIGTGVDIYHNGINDNFNPPMVGSPVFFKFGTKRATTEDAFKKLLDILYGTTNYVRGDIGDQLVFGGILQSFTENRGPGGSPLFSVQVVDPREILSNVVLLLNNYTGSTYNQKNMLNIYGFLEYNLTESEKNAISGNRNELRKVIYSDGSFEYTGNDLIESSNSKFPITGTGFSRRGPQGIPYYRIKDAINALMEYSMALPTAYKNKGFGGSISFRGHNYVIDFGSLPELPGLYYLDFDQMNLLELALEICDVASMDLYVSLLPVTNHSAHSYIVSHNSTAPQNKRISGIIRLDAIDRSKPPTFGAITQFLSGVSGVQNKDVGYELSNVVTDRFIVGAQEVDMHYFSTQADRPSGLSSGREWTLDCSFEQQVLPYYGKLGKHAVTIPKGFGAYQQILLDSTSLFANGVGAYYVATEMELRCAMISYDRWKDFLKMYNDVYMESTESNDAAETAVAGGAQAKADDQDPPAISNNYEVTVPRSVFPTYGRYFYGSDDLPYSPCNPPYGYPLYYKRMTKLGIPEGGLTNISSRLTSLHQMYAQVANSDATQISTIIQDQIRSLYDSQGIDGLTSFEQTYVSGLVNLLQNGNSNNIGNCINILGNSMQSYSSILSFMPTRAKQQTRNAMRVYNFLKSTAEECLGKKFLVKIPKKVNAGFKYSVTSGPNGNGPFGFRGRCIDQNFGCSVPNEQSTIVDFLNSGEPTSFQINYNGALKANYNTISEKFEYNYYPSNLGGFFPFDLYANVLGASTMRGLNPSTRPSGVTQYLIPQDLTNFINEQGRISPYVRFDNSQFLTFDSFGPEDFTQQVVTDNGSIIPDIASLLDNTAGDQFHSFDTYNNMRNDSNFQKQVAFVKCSVDENFYMAPKTIVKKLAVHARQYDKKSIKSIPSKIFVPCSGLEDGELVPGTGTYVDSMRYTHNVFIPKPTGQGNYSVLDFEVQYISDIRTNLITGLENNLDTNNVYALITLPNRVLPSMDARFRDGPMQEVNANMFKHYMGMDVVRGLPGFEEPAAISGPQTRLLYENNANVDARVQAWMAGRKAVQNTVLFGLPGRVQASMPSPVYPDLVAIPFISQERCYGPWISSKIDPQAVTNIGGKIEFIKDENLSPWNYSGYDLMNQAGILQASFSNSLLLASERGGFTIPGLIPSGGPSLCTALVQGGPLVTNIQINVDAGGISTTYQMDLYTASFGKLQKQKQDEISKMSRERQKLRDERNSLIRNGLGKGFTSHNYLNDYRQLQAGITPDPGVFNRPYTHFVASVSNTTDKNYSSVVGEHDHNNYDVNASMSSMEAVGETAQHMTNRFDFAREYSNTASASVQDIFAPASLSNSHPNMASRPYINNQAQQALFYE